MHEMSLAINIIDIACKEAHKNGAHKINSIEIKVGQLAGVLNDALSFSFNIAKSDTLAKDAELILNSISGKGHCHECNIIFDTDSFFSLCPKCESHMIEIVQGKDLKIESINVD